MSEKTASNAGKDVLYIDVDDEITAIIDKVHAGKQKIVALVLPKRATVLQSIVNMKLLKRAADSAHKNIVLITSEAGLLPLAGTVGIHVARSLQSKPEVPDAPGHASDEVEADEDMDDTDPADATEAAAAGSVAAGAAAKSGSSLDKTRTVGELAGAAALDNELDDEDSIDMENEEEEAADTGVLAGLTGRKAKKGANKKLKVPDFNKFRLLLILAGAGVVALIVLLYIGLSVLPKATIAIKTDSEAVSSSGALALKTTSGTTFDLKTGTVPAFSQQVQKTANQQVPATGQKNNGEKATGTIRFYNCNKDDTLAGTTHTIPAGTGVSSGGLTFITTDDVTVFPSNFTGNTCKLNVPSAPVGMTAQAGGARYNHDAANYTVSGYTTITGSGSATTGGTDDITKIVTQGDIDSAKQKLSAADTDSIKQELKTGLIAKSYYAVDATFNAGNPDVKTSVNPNDAADSVTVTQTITYTMLGMKTADLQKIIQNDVKGKIDLKKQKILDYGLDNASIAPQSQNPDGATVSYQTSVVVGSELNENTIKKDVAGKKAGDAKAIIKRNPGVTDVDVTYSPFWVSSIPKKVSKITVVVEKPTASSTAKHASNP
jgi:hypothetical protein